MRISLSQISNKLAMLAGAASLSALLLVAAPQAHAQTGAAFYQAELAAPVEARRAIVRDSVFLCDGAICTGSKSNSRAAIVCANLVREFGAVNSFVAGGSAMDAAMLAKCNKRAA